MASKEVKKAQEEEKGDFRWVGFQRSIWDVQVFNDVLHLVQRFAILKTYARNQWRFNQTMHCNVKNAPQVFWPDYTGVCEIRKIEERNTNKFSKEILVTMGCCFSCLCPQEAIEGSLLPPEPNKRKTITVLQIPGDVKTRLNENQLVNGSARDNVHTCIT